MSAPRFSKAGRVKKGGNKCPVCQRPDYCGYSDDDNFLLCMRAGKGFMAPIGWQFIKVGNSGGYIFKRDNGFTAQQSTPKQEPPNKQEPTTARACDNDLDRVYRAFLVELGLSTQHKQTLTDPDGKRRLDDKQIALLLARSVPSTATLIEICVKLLKQFGAALMSTIPGFYLDKGLLHCAVANKPALLLGSFDGELLTGLRYAPDLISKDQPKYSWFSSGYDWIKKLGIDGQSAKMRASFYGVPGKKYKYVAITEGEYKSVISQKYLEIPFISVPGVGNWRAGGVLDILGRVAEDGAAVGIFYDSELNPLTEQHESALAEALHSAGYQVKIAHWSKEYKGIDDLLIAGKTFTESSYIPGVTDMPVSRVIDEPELTSLYMSVDKKKKASIIRSAKGTGKTTQLTREIQKTIVAGKQVIAVGHRVSLLQESANRHGLDFYGNMKNISILTEKTKGLAITLDSLPRVIPNRLKNLGLLVVDESEQLLSHATGETMRDRRQAGLATLKQLIEMAEKVIFLDADAGKVSYQYLERVLGAGSIEVIVNTAKPRQKTYRIYDKEIDLKTELIRALERGERVFIATNSLQKSRILNRFLKKEGFAKGWLVNSESVGAQEEHLKITAINQVIGNYQYTIATPSLGTGVSIETDCIDRVFLFAGNGVNTHLDLMQQVARVRAPRSGSIHCYISKRNINKPCTIKELRDDCISNFEQTGIAIDYHPATGDIRSLESEEEYLTLWCDIQANRRQSMAHLRENFINQAILEGHELEFIGYKKEPYQARYQTARKAEQAAKEAAKAAKTGTKQDRKDARAARKAAKAVKSEAYNNLIDFNKSEKSIAKSYKTACSEVTEERIEAIISAPELKDEEYDKLAEKRKNSYVTPEERAELERYELCRFYGRVKPEIIKLDDAGRLRSRLKMLNSVIDPDYAKQRDLKEYEAHNAGYIQVTELKHFYRKADLIHTLLFKSGIYEGEISGKTLKDSGFLELVKTRQAEIETILDLKIKIDFELKPLGFISTLLDKIGWKAQHKRVRVGTNLEYRATLEEKHCEKVSYLAKLALQAEQERERIESLKRPITLDFEPADISKAS